MLVLDEPTSGLDANASFDLLGMLNQLSKSKRTIILTIHQPRLEIFHMFHKIVFLCEGQVSKTLNTLVYSSILEKVFYYRWPTLGSLPKPMKCAQWL